jgi:putative SOS response-associated peptidase YedK
MCGRFTLTWNEWRQVAGALGIEDEGDAAASYQPHFNIAPTDQHFILTAEFERRKARRARWRLINRWARDYSRASQCINARAETLERRPTFREAFQQRLASFPPMAFSNGPVPRASGSRSGFTRGRRPRAFRWSV